MIHGTNQTTLYIPPQEAEKSIRFYRNIRKGSAFEDNVLKLELSKLQRNDQSDVVESSSWTWSDLSKW